MGVPGHANKPVRERAEHVNTPRPQYLLQRAPEVEIERDELQRSTFNVQRST